MAIVYSEHVVGRTIVLVSKENDDVNLVRYGYSGVSDIGNIDKLISAAQSGDTSAMVSLGIIFFNAVEAIVTHAGYDMDTGTLSVSFDYSKGKQKAQASINIVVADVLCINDDFKFVALALSCATEHQEIAFFLLFELAAAIGNSEAQFLMGWWIKHYWKPEIEEIENTEEIDVGSDISILYSWMAYWFESSAAQGNGDAMYEMGEIFSFKGYPVEAEKCLSLAAAKGSVNASGVLARQYSAGGEFELSPERASIHFKEVEIAAKNKQEESYYILSLLLWYGYGTDADAQSAFLCMKKAASKELGDATAQTHYEIMRHKRKERHDYQQS